MVAIFASLMLLLAAFIVGYICQGFWRLLRRLNPQFTRKWEIWVENWMDKQGWVQ